MIINTSWFGPFAILLDNLTPLNIQETEMIDILAEDIQKNGLLNPLEIVWYLNFDGVNKPDKLYIAKGNQRYRALKKLGMICAPCYIKVYTNEQTRLLLEVLKSIIPFVKEEQNESVQTAVKYKEWEYAPEQKG